MSMRTCVDAGGGLRMNVDGGLLAVIVMIQSAIILCKAGAKGKMGRSFVATNHGVFQMRVWGLEY